MMVILRTLCYVMYWIAEGRFQVADVMKECSRDQRGGDTQVNRFKRCKMFGEVESGAATAEMECVSRVL